MPAALNDWGDYLTYRGVVRYSMSETIQEKFPTRGEQQTAYSLARVPWSRKNDFLAAVLPDVSIGAITGEQLNLGSYGTTNKMYDRLTLTRSIPQQHPVFRNMYVVDATVIGGDGAPFKDDDLKWITFREIGDDGNRQTGFAKIALTWSTLPYYPYLFDTTVDGVTVPDEDLTNITCNLDGYNELPRYTKVRVINKGQNLQIKGRVFYFTKDDGTEAIRVNDVATGLPLPVPEANQSIYSPSLLLSVTWYMVPAVPLAQYSLLNHVNQTSDLWFPQTFLPIQPQTGTLLHLGFEISDPYFTFSGTQVIDVTTALLYRPGGDDYNRGHNATWCGQERGFRRVVAGKVSTTAATGFTTPATLPNHHTANESDRLLGVDASGNRFNIHEFGELANLWKFESPPAEVTPWDNEFPIRNNT